MFECFRTLSKALPKENNKNKARQNSNGTKIRETAVDTYLPRLCTCKNVWTPAHSKKYPDYNQNTDTIHYTTKTKEIHYQNALKLAFTMQ